MREGKVKVRAIRIFCLAALACAFFLCCGEKAEQSSRPEVTGKLNIAVIPKGTTHEFWKAIHAGAVQASRELGVEVIWKGPQKEDDRAQQIIVVEDFISRGVDGIVLAPLDDRALCRPVQDAVREGIPVVIIDSGLQGEERLGEIVGGKGNIFLIRYQEGSASTTKRESGFLDTITSDFPNISLLVHDQHAGATTETAYQLAENLLGRFPEVDGIFCPNESSTFGTLRALQESGLAGKVKFVGFDSSPKLVQALSEGQIHGLVLQNPMKMGYLGVKQMVSHLKGEKIESRVDTGVYLA